MNKKQRSKRKTLTLSPMMPKRFSSAERAKIRAKEKEILGGK